MTAFIVSNNHTTNRSGARSHLMVLLSPARWAKKPSKKKNQAPSVTLPTPDFKWRINVLELSNASVFHTLF